MPTFLRSLTLILIIRSRNPVLPLFLFVTLLFGSDK